VTSTHRVEITTGTQQVLIARCGPACQLPAPRPARRWFQGFDNLLANVVTRPGPDNRRQNAADGQPG